MVRFCALLLLLVGAMGLASPARASGDFACSPSWQLGHRTLSGCDDMALLGPGNDTRTNFVLLLADMRHGLAAAGHPASGAAADPFFDWPTLRNLLAPPPPGTDPSDYATGEGSRCTSNDSGTASFTAAVGAARGLSDPERAQLIDARKAIAPKCAEAMAVPPSVAALDGLRSPAARAFAAYLRGAMAFYDGDYDTAAARFAALKTSDQPWLRETATYMLGRVELNRAQVNAYDEYGYPVGSEKIDQKLIAASDAALGAYIKAYPNGLYTLSARGLLRRVYWLGGNTAKLSAAYVALLAQTPAERGISDSALADEIDNKLLAELKPESVTNPILLAMLDLKAMRTGTNEEGEALTEVPITAAALQAQQHYFASNPALFDYLQAVHAFFVDNNPRAVMTLIPDAARQKDFSYLQFSRQMLRGMALEAVKDRNARGFWLEAIQGAQAPYQRAAIELALALHEERAGALDRVFAPDSPIQGSAARELLLMNVAPAPLLRQQAKNSAAPRHERDIALFTLLYKELTRGAYHDFVADLALVPPGASTTMGYFSLDESEHPALGVFTTKSATSDYDCPALAEVATRLAGEPHQAKSMLCLADFIRANGFDEFVLDSPPAANELGGTPSQFPGGNFARQAVYQAIIADRATPAQDRAYALYRAVNCYAPSGNNGCGGTEVPLARRKAWHDQLKKDYPASRWAKALKYYW
jgi:hypothetical protein